MTRKFTLQPLLEIAQTETHTAAVSLGTHNRLLQQQQQKLDLLLQYRADYQARLRHRSTGGLDASALRNFHDFMQKLEEAILQQRAAVTETLARAERAREEWQLKQRKAQAFDTLSQRHALAELRNEMRHEQKQQDELASRASYGKLQSHR